MRTRLYSNDFVELFNRGTATVDLSTWSIQYATGSGTTWQVTPLSGTVPAGGHYLTQLASAAAIGVSCRHRRDGTSNLAASGGKVALVDSVTALTVEGSGSCSRTRQWSISSARPRNHYEGGAAAPAIGNTTPPCARALVARMPMRTRATSPQRLERRTRPPPPRPSTARLLLRRRRKRRRRPPHPVASYRAGAAGISFGSASPGEMPAPGSERVTVSSNTQPGTRSTSTARPSFRRLIAWPVVVCRAGELGRAGQRPMAVILIVRRRPAHRDDVPSEHRGRRCLGERRRVRRRAAVVAPGHYIVTVTFTAIGPMIRSVAVARRSLVLVLVPASAGASADVPVALTARRPEKCSLEAAHTLHVRTRDPACRRGRVSCRDSSRPAWTAPDRLERRRRSAAAWLTLQPTHFTIGPRSTASLVVTSKRPLKAEPGDHDALALLVTRPFSSGGWACA